MLVLEALELLLIQRQVNEFSSWRMSDCESLWGGHEAGFEHGKERTERNTVRKSKSLPDSTNPLDYDALPPVINCLMNLHKSSNEIGQNHASHAV